MTPAPELPAGRIEWIADRHHVGTPDAELAAEIRRRCIGPGWTPRLCERAVRIALARHAENRATYATVTRGYQP